MIPSDTANAVARGLIDKLRATAEVRPAAEPAVGLVPDANGGDPILYGDDEQGAYGGRIQRQRA